VTLGAPSTGGVPSPGPPDGPGAPTPRRSLTGRASGFIDDGRRKASDRWEQTEQRWPQVAVLVDIYQRYLRYNGAALAGHIAFRLFLWILPVMLLGVSVAGLARDAGADVEQTTSGTLGLGQGVARNLAQATAETQSSRYHLLFVTLSGLILGLSGLLSAMNLTHATMWGFETKKVRRRGHLITRMLAAVPLIAIILFANSLLRKAGFVGGVAGALLTAAIYFGMLFALSVMLPRRATDWRWLLPGPVVGASLTIGLSLFATVYLPSKVASMTQTYGTMGVAAVALTYLYLIGSIFVSSPLISAAVYDRFGPGADEHPAGTT